MARAWFGGGAADFVFTSTAGGFIRRSAATLTFWSAATGGTQHTDLLLNGSAMTSISVGNDGQVPEFQGPDGVVKIWADAGGGTRVQLDAGISSEDGAVSTLVESPTSLTRGSLGKVYERGLSVTAYGAKGDSTTDDTAAIQAALNAIGTDGGTVYFPAPAQFYKITSPLTVKNGTVLQGASSTKSLVSVTTGSMFAPTTLWRELSFRHMNLQVHGTNATGHIFNLGATGGMAMCSYTECSFVTHPAGASVVKQDGTGDYLWNWFSNCDFTRFSTSTAPGFDMRNTNAGLNCNVWENCRVTSSDAASYYWKLRADAAGTVANENAWRNITGELNAGGLIWLDSAEGATFEDVRDYDVAGSYVGSIIRIGKAAGGFPGGIKLSNVGNRGGTVNGTTAFHLDVQAGTTSPCILDRVADHLGASKLRFAAGYGATVLDASGATSVLIVSTVSKTLDHTAEGIVFFNGTSLTATLPNPASVQPGRIFRVKNLHSTALTVTSGVSIDGVGSKSLAQYAAGSYTTDGGNWFTI